MGDRECSEESNDIMGEGRGGEAERIETEKRKKMGKKRRREGRMGA